MKVVFNTKTIFCIIINYCVVGIPQRQILISLEG